MIKKEKRKNFIEKFPRLGKERRVHFKTLNCQTKAWNSFSRKDKKSCSKIALNDFLKLLQKQDKLFCIYLLPKGDLYACIKSLRFISNVILFNFAGLMIVFLFRAYLQNKAFRV